MLRKGYSADGAKDSTQEFFARLLGRNYLSVADRNKGKFPSRWVHCNIFWPANGPRRMRKSEAFAAGNRAGKTLIPRQGVTAGWGE